MKLTLGEAMNMAQALPALLDKEIPAKAAYWLSRATDQLQSELKAFETARFKLIEKWGERDAGGELINTDNQFKITDTEAFTKEYDEIASQEFEIKYEPIFIESLGDINVSVKTLMGLGRLLKDDEEGD